MTSEASAIEWITDAVVAAIERGEAVGPVALIFLLRRYQATDRVDVRDALEPGLALGLNAGSTAETTAERAAWLMLFSEAAALSDDDRLQAGGAELIGALRQDWGRTAEVEPAAV